MIALRPMLQLLGRASVFWLAALVIFCLSLAIAGIFKPEAGLGQYLDGIFVAAVLFPGCAGSIAGAVVQEFEHTSFAAVLPGVRYRLGSGFVCVGLAVTVLVVAVIGLNASSPVNLALLFVVGLCAFCLGGLLPDPLSAPITMVVGTIGLLLVAASRDLARVTGEHPWGTVALAGLVAVASVSRLFARSTFRRKPGRPTSPFPGRFSLERKQQFERERRLADGPRKSAWRRGYLGEAASRWVRAAMHEVYGAHGWKSIPRAIGKAWALGLLVLLYAWLDKGEMSYGKAVAASLYDALFRNPHVPQFGESGGPYPLVLFALGGAAIATAWFSPIALGSGLTYPLSRSQQARVLFGGGLVHAGIFVFVVAPVLLAIGYFSGWVLGYAPRFDFMPFFLRVLLVSVILMPLAHRGRLGSQAASRRRAANTMIGMIFGVCGFVLLAGIGTFVSPRLFGSPQVELSGLALALVLSQWLYRRGLTSYFRTVDLA